MRKRLSAAVQNTFIVTRSDFRNDDKPQRFDSEMAARAFLRRHTSEAGVKATLRQALGEDMPNAARFSDAQVLTQVAKRLANGRIRIVGVRPQARAAPAAKQQAPAQQPAAPAAPAPAVQPKKTYWVKFQVLDEVTSLPMANVKLKIKLPGNRVVNHTTNAQGLVVITGLPTNGTCELQEMIHSDSLEVTKVQQG